MDNTALAEINKAQQTLERANDIHEILDLRDKAAAMQLFANAQGFKEAAQEAKIFQLRAERKAGDWLAANVKHEGGDLNTLYQDGTALPNGIDRHESSRWQSEASVPEDSFNDWIDDCLSTGKEISAAGLRRIAANYHGSDDSYEWFTPSEYVEAARRVMNGIDLDPASTKEANEIIKALQIYTVVDDGLAHDWHGKVFLNPPYNMPYVEQFIDRTISEYENGNINCAIVLVNNSTDTAWFHHLLAYPICLTKGRIHFWSNGGITLATRQGQAFFYLGLDIDKFAQEFGKFGVILMRYDYQ